MKKHRLILVGLGRLLLRRLILSRELQADAVDTVALISGRGVTLALEDVAEVATAVSADNLDAAHAESPVLVSDNGARDAVEVGWPTAARAELVSGLVQWRVASGASVDAGIWGVLVELAGAWSLGSLLP